MRRDLRGTWSQALASLAVSLLVILCIRWAFFEPYVIPSGSMVPTLLIHDHILVNKFAYGLRVPFTSVWLLRFSTPKRGEVIVFRSLQDDSTFMVKRVVGVEGDEIRVNEDGRLLVNGQVIPTHAINSDQLGKFLLGWPSPEHLDLVEKFRFFEETLDHSTYLTMHERERVGGEQGPFEVPEGALFLMGDNRDGSADSRSWGFLPKEKVLGRAFMVWLSCEETLPESDQVCDPKTVRWNRMFMGIR